MKILIIGEYFSANLGDGVICESVQYLLKKTESINEIEILDISGNSRFIDEKDAHKLINVVNNTKIDPANCKTNLIKIFIKKIINRLYSYEYVRLLMAHIHKRKFLKDKCKDNYDLVVFAGGQLFIEYFILSIDACVKQLRKKNIPIVFNACGMGKEIKNKSMRNKLIKSLNSKNVEMITTRDNINLLKKYVKKQSNIRKIGDPAIWASEAYDIKKDETSDFVGLGIMWLPGEEENLINFWSKLIDDLDEEGIKWKMFCNGCPLDYGFAIKILNTKGIEITNNILLERPTSPKELVKLISRFKSIISFRLHSHIIAYSLDIPTIALIWNDKLNFFAKTIDCSSRYFDFKKVDSKHIIKSLSEAEKYGYNSLIKEKLKSEVETIFKEYVDLMKSN